MNNPIETLASHYIPHPEYLHESLQDWFIDTPTWDYKGREEASPIAREFLCKILNENHTDEELAKFWPMDEVSWIFGPDLIRAVFGFMYLGLGGKVEDLPSPPTITQDNQRWYELVCRSRLDD